MGSDEGRALRCRDLRAELRADRDLERGSHGAHRGILHELLGLDAGYVWPIDFASGPDGAAYLIVEDNDPDAPHDGTRPATVFRIDGLR